MCDMIRRWLNRKRDIAEAESFVKTLLELNKHLVESVNMLISMSTKNPGITINNIIRMTHKLEALCEVYNKNKFSNASANLVINNLIPKINKGSQKIISAIDEMNDDTPEKIIKGISSGLSEVITSMVHLGCILDHDVAKIECNIDIIDSYYRDKKKYKHIKEDSDYIIRIKKIPTLSEKENIVSKNNK